LILSLKINAERFLKVYIFKMSNANIQKKKLTTNSKNRLFSETVGNHENLLCNKICYTTDIKEEILEKINLIINDNSTSDKTKLEEIAELTKIYPEMLGHKYVIKLTSEYVNDITSYMFIKDKHTGEIIISKNGLHVYVNIYYNKDNINTYDETSKYFITSYTFYNNNKKIEPSLREDIFSNRNDYYIDDKYIGNNYTPEYEKYLTLINKDVLEKVTYQYINYMLKNDCYLMIM
jgi:hypothetical protein